MKYERRERFAGASKYPLRKMLAFAWHGITSFSSVPLRWVTSLGALVSAPQLPAGRVGAVPAPLRARHVVVGWASTVVPLVFLGGVQLLGIGILGEYVGKVYLEVKRRPRFVIERRL